RKNLESMGTGDKLKSKRQVWTRIVCYVFGKRLIIIDHEIHVFFRHDTTPKGNCKVVMLTSSTQHPRFAEITIYDSHVCPAGSHLNCNPFMKSSAQNKLIEIGHPV